MFADVWCHVNDVLFLDKLLNLVKGLILNVLNHRQKSIELRIKKQFFGNIFFYFGPPKKNIFFTTIYGLYLSHNYTLHYKLHFIMIWTSVAAFIYCIHNIEYYYSLKRNHNGYKAGIRTRGRRIRSHHHPSIFFGKRL